MYELSLQRLISLAGSHGPLPGSALWRCGDCGEALGVRRQSYSNDRNSESMLAWRDELERIFASRRALSEEEHDALQGRMVLEGLIRRIFRAPTTSITILPHPDGYAVEIVRDGGKEMLSDYFNRRQAYAIMHASYKFATARGESNRMLMSVRIDKDERHFAIVQQIASGGLALVVEEQN